MGEEDVKLALLAALVLDKFHTNALHSSNLIFVTNYVPKNYRMDLALIIPFISYNLIYLIILRRHEKIVEEIDE